MGKRSIKNKVMTVILLCICLAITFYLIYAVSVFKKDKLAYIYDTSAAWSETIANNTDNFFEDINKTSDLLLSFYKKNNKNLLNDVILSTFNSNPNLIEFSIVDADQNKEIISLIKKDYLIFHKQESDFLKKIKQKQIPLFNSIKNDDYMLVNVTEKDDIPIMMLAQKKDNRYLVILSIDYTPLLDLFLKNTLYRVTLLTDTGSVLIGSDKQYQNSEQLKLVKTSALKTTVKEYKSKNDVNFIASFSKTNLKDIIVITEIESDVAFSAAKKLIEKSILFAILLLSLGVLVSVFFSKKITDPIMKIYSATKELAKGNFNIKINLKTNDEISTLADSFNFMTTEIVRLMEEMKDKVRMEKEFEVAKAVQDTLFPESNTANENIQITSYFQPATECGGDWFDYFETKNHLLMLIGDATGHGVPSALITATAHSCCNTLFNLSKNGLLSLTPSIIMEYLNKAVSKAANGKILMTFFIVLIDKKTGLLAYSNASHNPPYICNANNCKTKDDLIPLLDVNGARLGENPDSQYEQGLYQLNESDILVLFTDGIIECKDVQDNQWGVRKYLKSIIEGSKLLTIEDLKNNIINEMNQFKKHHPLEDDVSLLICKYTK